MPEKYGLSGCMPAVVSSTDGSNVAGTSEAEGSAPVAALLEVRQEGLADLVGSHATIVAHPTTTSPRSRQAICPGAAP